MNNRAVREGIRVSPVAVMRISMMLFSRQGNNKD